MPSITTYLGNFAVITLFCTAFVFLYDGECKSIGREATDLAPPSTSAAFSGTSPESEEGFESYLKKSNSGKRLHNYGFMYAPFFDPLRNKKIAFLEIGLCSGDSLDLWDKFFTMATIYGIDKGSHNDGFKKYIGKKAEVKIFVGDQEDVSFLTTVSDEIRKESGVLDFIIDDGGHTMSQQITSFTNLMPLVKPGGTYFIEDLETSYYHDTKWGCYGQDCGGGAPGKAGTTVAFIKSMIDVVNEDFQKGPNTKSMWRIGNYSVNPVDHMVGSIHCWRNLCALVKKKENSYF